MSESNPARRRRLEETLRTRSEQLPPEFARLAEALWNETDDALSHEECLAVLPEYVNAEVEGERVVLLYPAMKHHLDRCDTCAEQYADLLEVTLADLSHELPQATDMPVLDLSFLPPLRRVPQGSLPKAAQEKWAALVTQLQRLVLLRDIALSGARAATALAGRGQTPEGVLRWRIAEDEEQNLIIRLGSHVVELEGLALRLNAGDWQRELILARVAPDQIGAEVTITHEERTRLRPNTPLHIDLLFKDSPTDGS